MAMLLVRHLPPTDRRWPLMGRPTPLVIPARPGPGRRWRPFRRWWTGRGRRAGRRAAGARRCAGRGETRRAAGMTVTRRSGRRARWWRRWTRNRPGCGGRHGWAAGRIRCCSGSVSWVGSPGNGWCATCRWKWKSWSRAQHPHPGPDRRVRPSSSAPGRARCAEHSRGLTSIARRHPIRSRARKPAADRYPPSVEGRHP